MLYAIADLHLSFGVNKPMDVFPGWQDYTMRLKNSWEKLVTPEDTVVLAGDTSWGMRLSETLPDFAFLDALPGRKLIIKGNHDYWWETRRKLENFFGLNGLSTLEILHNSAILADGIAVCGTRGWFYDAERDEDKKVVNREAGRLAASIIEAKKLDGEPVVFLHYPPVYNEMVCEEIMAVLTEQGIRRCYYGHIHGGNAARRAFQGEFRGVELKLISGDFLHFVPLCVQKN